MTLQMESGRHLFAVGRSERPGIKLARRCAWGDGGHWMSEADAALAEGGAQVSHTICEAHSAEVTREIDGWWVS